MSQDYIVPVDHSAGSAVATTAASAAKHGLTGMLKGAGVALGLGGLIGGFAAVSLFAAHATILGAIGIGAIGVGLGVVGSMVAFPFVGSLIGGFAALGAALGLIGGTAKGVNKVSHEQGAAQMMQAQLAAEAAQSQAPNIYAQDVNMPAQGSRMNAADSKIDLAGLQRDGVVADNLALQRA